MLRRRRWRGPPTAHLADGRTGRQRDSDPIHPVLTDLPIGFWTSAWLLDLLPGRDAHSDAARRLLGAGVVSALPAALTGTGDAAALGHEQRRIAALHAALNVAATTAFAWSWWLRRRQPTTPAARLACHVGAGLATAAGMLGGHLAFASGSDSGQPADDGEGAR